MLLTDAPAEASSTTFLPKVKLLALMLPPSIAGAAEYCPAIPALSLVKVPAVLMVTLSLMVVLTLPNSTLLPAAIMFALICASEMPLTEPPSTKSPFGAIFNSSLTVNLPTLPKSILLKPFLLKSALITDSKLSLSSNT